MTENVDNFDTILTFTDFELSGQNIVSETIFAKVKELNF